MTLNWEKPNLGTQGGRHTLLGICLFLILFVLLNYFWAEDMDLRMKNCISEVQGVCTAQPSGEHVCVGDRSEVSAKLWHEKGLCKCMLICVCECTRAQGKVRSVWGLRAHVHDREFEAAGGYA